jgi:extradiol dioxygenase family protein
LSTGKELKMIKNVEIEMYGHKWLIEIDQYSSDEFDFDINQTMLNHNGVTLDMSDLVDAYHQLESYMSYVIAEKLEQEALNNV